MSLKNGKYIKIVDCLCFILALFILEERKFIIDN